MRRTISTTLGLVAAVFLSACDRQTAQVKQAAYRPQYVYQKYCAPCHDATNLHLIQEPPRLDGLFRKKTFPSGAPATDGELRNVVLHGRGTMPPFEGTFSGEDLDGLVRYMHTR
jgi:mono/diheme cytochrome c family protein